METNFLKDIPNLKNQVMGKLVRTFNIIFSTLLTSKIQTRRGRFTECIFTSSYRTSKGYL